MTGLSTSLADGQRAENGFQNIDTYRVRDDARGEETV
jgi:hypothetical protein